MTGATFRAENTARMSMSKIVTSRWGNQAELGNPEALPALS
jgi:hypothetical protein